RNTRGLDLAVGDVCGSDGLDAELAEGHRGAAGGVTATTGVVLLAELDLTWNQHCYASTPAATGASALGAAARRGRSRSPRSGRDDFWFACSRASSLLVMSPL